MDHTVSPRYEVKLCCDPCHLGEIHAWVRLHAAHWCVAYPPRQVNNIYFDTYDHQSLNANLGGIGTRQKLRLRWYGPDLGVVADAQLELKCRRGSVGWKEACVLQPAPTIEAGDLDLACHSWPVLLEAIMGTADARAKVWLKHLSYPVLINSYQRAYFVTPDQAVRLTIDTGLRAFDQRFSSRPNLSRPAPLSDNVIVELKADREHHARLANLLDHFPVRISRSSKYVQGMLTAPDFDGMRPL